MDAWIVGTTARPKGDAWSQPIEADTHDVWILDRLEPFEPSPQTNRLKHDRATNLVRLDQLVNRQFLATLVASTPVVRALATGHRELEDRAAVQDKRILYLERAVSMLTAEKDASSFGSVQVTTADSGTPTLPVGFEAEAGAADLVDKEVEGALKIFAEWLGEITSTLGAPIHSVTLRRWNSEDDHSWVQLVVDIKVDVPRLQGYELWDQASERLAGLLGQNKRELVSVRLSGA